MSHNQPKSIVSNNQSTTAPRVANQKKPIPGPLVVEHTEESRTDVQEEEEEEQPQPQSPHVSGPSPIAERRVGERGNLDLSQL